MLQAIMQDALRERDLTTREAAAEIGVSHATVTRILKNGTSNLETLLKISQWTGMSVDTLLGREQNEDTQMIRALLTGLFEAEPKLLQIFRDAYQELRNGNLDLRDFYSILSYIPFRLVVLKRLERSETDSTNSE